MSRTKYAKCMADAGRVDDGTAAVLAQAPKSSYDAADIQKQNDAATKDVAEGSKSRMDKVRDVMAGTKGGGEGFAGGLMTGMSLGAKAKKAWGGKADGGALESGSLADDKNYTINAIRNEDLARRNYENARGTPSEEGRLKGLEEANARTKRALSARDAGGGRGFKQADDSRTKYRK